MPSAGRLSRLSGTSLLSVECRMPSAACARLRCEKPLLRFFPELFCYWGAQVTLRLFAALYVYMVRFAQGASECPGVRVSGCPSVQASGCPTGAVLVASAPAWRSYGRDGAGRGRGGGGLWAGRMYKTRERRIKQKRLSIVDNLFSVSGRLDSNQRPPTPEAGALTGLRYTPNWARFIFKSAQRYV